MKQSIKYAIIFCLKNTGLILFYKMYNKAKELSTKMYAKSQDE